MGQIEMGLVLFCRKVDAQSVFATEGAKAVIRVYLPAAADVPFPDAAVDINTREDLSHLAK
jgi:hypothetical protein